MKATVNESVRLLCLLNIIIITTGDLKVRGEQLIVYSSLSLFVTAAHESYMLYCVVVVISCKAFEK